MPPEMKCMLCQQVISADDTVDADGNRLMHVDCARPRSLRPEENVYLYVYCWNHSVAECSSCGRSFTQEELIFEPFGASAYHCLHCHQDLTDTVRAHLLACFELPEQLRQKVREAAKTTQALRKWNRELRDRADVLKREIEAAQARLDATQRNCGRKKTE